MRGHDRRTGPQLRLRRTQDRSAYADHPGQDRVWEYTFEPLDEGTRVTETWTDLRTSWPDWAAAIFDKTATGGRLFSDFQRRNIKRTLAAMKTDFEGQRH